MRYIRVHTIVTKIFDGNVVSLDETKDILHSAKNKEYDCEISLKDGMKYEWIRVSDVQDDRFTAKVMLNTSSVLTKTFLIKDIATFIIRSSGDDIVRKGNATRMSTIDILGDDILC